MQFDALFQTLVQRHRFLTYLAGLLLPHERSKTLTALVGAEPPVQVQAAHSFRDVVGSLPLPAWCEVIRRFRDGHTERWWADPIRLWAG